MTGETWEAPRTRMKTSFATALAVSLATLLTGCVGLLPIPPLSNQLLAGRVIKQSDASFIVPGCTTRLEVERRLGPCSRDCPRAPSVAYSWERPGWTMFWWVVGRYGGIGDNFAVGGWHALFVAFDDDGVVLQKEFASLSDLSSLDEQLEQWAERVRKKKHPIR